jgi:hypothetical protein
VQCHAPVALAGLVGGGCFIFEDGEVDVVLGAGGQWWW